MCIYDGRSEFVCACVALFARLGLKQMFVVQQMVLYFVDHAFF